MPRLSQWMIRAAFVYLLLGFTVGALLLAHKGIPLHPALWGWLPAHMEFLLMGWIVQLTMGVAFWILPRYWQKPARPRETYAQVAFVLLNVGIWLVVAGTTLRIGRWAFFAGRVVELGAALFFGLQSWRRIVSREGYSRASIRAYILILTLAVILASCSTPTAPTPSPQIATTASNIVTPAKTDTVQQSTPTLVSTETQAPSNLSLAVDNLLASYVDSGAFSGSVLIARNGEILLSDGYGLADRRVGIPNTPQTKFRLGSITKQFTAAAVLLLQEQGKLTVQDAICDYLSDCPAAWQTITIHHLLTHTSGIPDLTSFPEYPSWRATPSAPLETLERFNGMPLDFPRGEAWRYSNSGYIVLGVIIEQAAGQSYEAFLQENIFTPLNMTATGYDHNSNELAVGYARDAEADFIDMSIPFAAGGLYSTVEDLYRWDQALFNGALLSQASLSEMFSEHAAIPGPEGSAYGYGWVIGQNNGRRVFEHRGAIEGFVSVIAHYPDENEVIILLSNQQNVPLNALYDLLFSQVISDGE